MFLPHIFLPPCTLPLWSVDKPRSAAHRVGAYCRRSAYLILPLQHHRQWKKQWSCTKSSLTYTISHQIWVFTASIVVKWPVGWLISKPAVKPLAYKMGRLSFSFFVNIFGTAVVYYTLTVCLSLLLSAMKGTKSPHSNSCFTNSQFSFW